MLTLLEYLLTLFRLEERARAFFTHDAPQRAGGDRPDRGPRRRPGRGRPRPAARQLRQRRRLRARPDRRPPAPPLALDRRAAAAPADALRPADDAGRALALPAQLRRPDRHRPLRRPRRGRPLLARGQVRAGGQRARPRLPARLAAARLLDPRRRRGAPRLRRDRHLVRRRLRLRRHRHVAVLALDRPRPGRAAVLRLLRSDRPDRHRRHPLRPLHGAGRDPRPHRPHRVQLPGDDRRPGRQPRAQPRPRAPARHRRRRPRPGRLLRRRRRADVRVHPAPLPGPLRVGTPRPRRCSSPPPWSGSANCCCRPTGFVGLAARIALWLAYPAVLLLSGFFTAEERGWLARLRHPGELLEACELYAPSRPWSTARSPRSTRQSGWTRMRVCSVHHRV